MKKAKLSLCLLSVLPSFLFSCTNKDYKLVTYDYVRDTYVPVIEDCKYTYDELKTYLKDLPFIIPGDRLKIEYGKDGTPESYKMIPAKTVLLDAWYSLPCGDITHADFHGYSYSYVEKRKTEPGDDFSIWEIRGDKLITTDLSLVNKLPEKYTIQYYFTYSEEYRNKDDDNKIIVQSVWDVATFEKYVKR